MIRLTALLAVLAASCVVSLAAGTAHVLQKNRSFNLARLQLATGETVVFENADDFPHQIHISGPGVDLDSDLQAPGGTTQALFPREGTFAVTCGIHPRMRMVIDVR